MPLNPTEEERQSLARRAQTRNDTIALRIFAAVIFLAGVATGIVVALVAR